MLNVQLLVFEYLNIKIGMLPDWKLKIILKMSSIKIDHATASLKFNKDEAHVDWHDETLWFVRSKRDKAVFQISEWEQLREAGS